jgi:NAD(P)-dependent dehydrogenase (short-subunit alcohol dehydrogenase family)
MKSYSKNPSIFDISNKTIIVTGGNAGNGLAISSAIADAGARLVRVDLAFDTELDSHDINFDLHNTAEISALIEGIFSEYGRIDGLVNNAGISIDSSLAYYDDKIFNRTMTVNATAAFKMCAEVCPLMAKNGGGSIINITSLGSKLGFPKNPAYQMSKAAISQLTRSIAFDWGGHGIRANNVGPGYIHTAMTYRSFNDPILYEERLRRTLLKRWGVPSDLAGPVVFLLSDASSYITGSDIWVDGGWTASGF